MLGSLALLRVADLHREEAVGRRRGGFVEGFRYVRRRPDLRAIMLMLFLVGTFGLNFPIFISTMSVTAFHVGASRFGLLTSFAAVGSVVGALLAARRANPSIATLVASAAVFGAGFAMPDHWLFGVALVVVGMAPKTATTTAISTVQLSTEPAMRGRVMALLLAITLGGTPLGAPLVGWVADRFGPRWALGVAVAAGFVAAAVGLRYLATHRHLRFDTGRARFTMDDTAA